LYTIPEALGIAYQDAKGIWQAQGGIVVDKVNETVKVTTTHFSDWSLFESFYLSSSRTVVPEMELLNWKCLLQMVCLLPWLPAKKYQWVY
jgi:hypothetical protein